MPPRRVSGLRDPDVRFRAVLQKYFAHPRDLSVPTIPPKFKRARKSVDTNCVDVLHHAAFAHESHPLRIHRPARSEHGFFAALPRPMRRAADHFAKDQPMRIERRVPLERAPWLVPKLDPLEKVSESTDKDVEEISVLFWIAWRRALTWSDTKTGRRVVKAWKHVEFPCEPRQQPVIPFFSAVSVPVGPRDSRAQFRDPDCLQVDKETLDTFGFAGTKPFQDAQNRTSAVFHTARPRKFSSRTA